MKKILTLAACILYMSPAQAADDPGGWTGAKWGMSADQILQALPDQAVRLNPPEKYNHATAHIPSFQLAGASFHVYFIPDNDGHLKSVVFSPLDVTREGLDFLFQRLQNLLIEKYGRPWKSTEQANTEIQWTFKTTTIILSRTQVKDFGTQFVSLRYKQKESDLDKM